MFAFLTDGQSPLSTFMYHNSNTAIMYDGPKPSIATLNNTRKELADKASCIWHIVDDNPFYKSDLLEILDDGPRQYDGVIAAVERYIYYLNALPDRPPPDLLKLTIDPRRIALQTSVTNYIQWIEKFNNSAHSLRDELLTFANIANSVSSLCERVPLTRSFWASVSAHAGASAGC